MLTLIPTPIGSLKDISLNVIDRLKEAEVFICEDTRVSKRLLYLLNEKLNLNIKYEDREFIPFHSHTKNLSKLDFVLKNKDCVYLTDAGMPCVSDPGSELVNFCIKHNIKYETLPGSNAALLAYSLSGFSQKEFLFYGFLPHKKDRLNQLNQVLNSGFVVILYEAPTRIKQLLNEIYNIDKERVVFIAKELTKINQFFIKDKIKNLVNKNINFKGEWVLVIEAKKKKINSLSYEDIISLNIPPKIKAKLLSKITGENVKLLYEKLIKN